jgi:hypothetical protein
VCVGRGREWSVRYSSEESSVPDCQWVEWSWLVRREGESAAAVEGWSGWASADELFGVRAFRLSVRFCSLARTCWIWNPKDAYRMVNTAICSLALAHGDYGVVF